MRKTWYHRRAGKGGSFPYMLESLPAFLLMIRNPRARLVAEHSVMYAAYKRSRTRYPYPGHGSHQGNCATCYQRAKGR